MQISWQLMVAEICDNEVKTCCVFRGSSLKTNKPILTSGSKTGSQTDSSDGLAATVLPS